MDDSGQAANGWKALALGLWSLFLAGLGDGRVLVAEGKDSLGPESRPPSERASKSLLAQAAEEGFPLAWAGGWLAPPQGARRAT